MKEGGPGDLKVTGAALFLCLLAILENPEIKCLTSPLSTFNEVFLLREVPI